jgi:putative membrane protein
VHRYNPSSYPPITRDNLLVLWQNGLPRQQAYKAEDIVAVPLTQPATFDGYAFDLLPGTAKPSAVAVEAPSSATHPEAHASAFTTNSEAFKRQAVESAVEYTKSDDPAIIGSSRLDEKHRLGHINNSDGREQVTITTVELMPPRHPPTPRVWDFIPPLRVFKVIWDWFRKKRRIEEEEREKCG